MEKNSIISGHLKRLRKEAGMTLRQLSEKVEYGTGNLSSYENGKIGATDSTYLRILIKGFDFSEDKAKIELARWRKEELEETYHLELAQPVVAFNEGKKKSPQKLKAFLEGQGFDVEAIEKIVTEAEKYR